MADGGNGDPRPTRPVRVRFPVIGGQKVAVVIANALSQGNAMADIKLEVLGAIPRGGTSVKLPGGSAVDLNADPICLIAWEDRTGAQSAGVDDLAKAILHAFLSMPVDEFQARYDSLRVGPEAEKRGVCPQCRSGEVTRLGHLDSIARGDARWLCGPCGWFGNELRKLDKSVQNGEGECQPSE